MEEEELETVIDSMLDRNLTHVQISQELLSEHSINKSVSTLKRFCRSHNIESRMSRNHKVEEQAVWFPVVKQRVRSGLSYSSILTEMKTRFGVVIGRTALIAVLKANDVHANEKFAPHLVVDMVRHQLEDGKVTSGYRGMTTAVRRAFDCNVGRDVVRAAQKQLDPVGVENRKKKCLVRRDYTTPGPNHCWHFDGFDKVSRFHFCIHGCIDGFSRKLIWLDVAYSNRIPDIISSYYARAVEEFNIQPDLTRSDYGTENTKVATIRITMLGEKAHIFGPSTGNQRIERYWESLQKFGVKFWINFFKDMESRGHYDYEDPYDSSCACFVFGPGLVADLKNIKFEWNNHRVRKSKQYHGGIPDHVYHNPGEFQKESCGSKPAEDFIEVFAMENDVFDKTDPFFLNNYKATLQDALFSGGFTEEITKLNMLEAFNTLKSSISGRTEFMLLLQSVEDTATQ